MYISRDVPIQGGQENPPPLRESRLFTVAAALLLLLPRKDRLSDVIPRTFAGVRFLPLNSIADLGVAVKIRESGAGNSLQTPFFSARRGKMASGSFLHESLDFLFSLASLLPSSLLPLSQNEARNNDLAIVWTRERRKTHVLLKQAAGMILPTMHFVATTESILSYFQ